MTHQNHAIEEWRPVVGFEGSYSVSNHGNVKSIDRKRGRKQIKGRPLHPFKERSGHYYIQLHENGTTKGCFVHRLVLLAFVGECPQGEECCHIDGNPANNHVDNLRWGTRKSNIRDMLIAHMSGGKCCNARLSFSQIIEIKKMALQKEKYAVIARKLSISAATVWNVATGRSWSHIKINEEVCNGN